MNPVLRRASDVLGGSRDWGWLFGAARLGEAVRFLHRFTGKPLCGRFVSAHTGLKELVLAGV